MICPYARFITALSTCVVERLSSHVVSDWRHNVCGMEQWIGLLSKMTNCRKYIVIHFNYHTLLKCLKSWIWLWIQFLVMHCIYHTYFSVKVAYTLKSWFWLWMQFFSDALNISHTSVSVELIQYMMIMFEVMNLTMNAILSDALSIYHTSVSVELI